MKLPPLSLDLRKSALEASGDYVFVIVPSDGDHVIARINSVAGSYDHAGEMVDRINNWPSAITELRRLAILPTQARGIQKVVHDGHMCRVCHGTWKLDKPEFHATTCPLKGT